jgi:2-polyprenyl-3-methyl-5-hydroxy-6-metoxy-1,4-benzoquinol methylase
MSSASCPQCGQSASFFMRAKDYNRHITDEVFTYFRCGDCGLIFQSPVPHNLSDYYPPEYYLLPSTLEELEPQIEFQKYKIDLVEKFVSGGRLLEIGPGRGDFAFWMKRAGFTVDVIEMDAVSCQFLRDVIQVNAIQSSDVCGTLQSLGQYNVIALWQVIEHLSDPWAVVDILSDHLLPGGLLIIATPNPEAVQFKLFRHRWTHLDAPRHLELIPATLLSKRLERTGLTLRLLTTNDQGARIHNRVGWQYSLNNITGHSVSMFYPGAILNRLFAPLESKGYRGTTYTAFFQK